MTTPPDGVPGTQPEAAGPASTGPGPLPPTSDTVPGPPVGRDLHDVAEPIAAAVLACPAVASLSAGPFGTVGTYLPGRRITGVQITDTTITVRVVGRPVLLRTLEAQVRGAVAVLAPGMTVDIGLDGLDIGDPALDGT